MSGDWADPATSAIARDKIVVDTKDRFFKLGIFPVATTSPARSAKPAGVRAISGDAAHTIVSSDPTGQTNIIAAANNYVVDASHGRIYIPAGSSINAGDTIYVQYTPIAATIPRVDFTDPKQARGAVRYIEDSASKNAPSRGNFGSEFFAPLCTVTPDGESQIKSRNDPQTISLSISVQEPNSGPSFVILQQGA